MPETAVVPAAPVGPTPAVKGAPSPPAPAPQPVMPPAAPPPSVPPASTPEGQPPKSVTEARGAIFRRDRLPSTAAEARAQLGAQPTVSAAPVPPAEAPAGTWPYPAPRSASTTEARGEVFRHDRQHHSDAQPRNDKGQFAGPPSAASAPEAATADAAPAPSAIPPATVVATAPPDTQAATETAETSPVSGRIPIPEDHPLRARGREYLDQLTPDELKGLLNNPIRRAQVEEAIARAHEWKEHAERLEAEREVLRTPTDPDVLRIAEEIGEMHGEEAKAFFLAGREIKQGQQVDEKLAERRRAEAEAENEAVANRFIDDATHLHRSRYPQWSNTEFAQVLGAYGALVQERGQTSLSMDELRQMADIQYLQRPDVREDLKARRQAEANRMREEIAKTERERLAAEEREKLEAAAERRRGYPLGRLPSTAIAAQAVGVTPAGATTVTEARKQLFDRRRA